jgi:hypothetical protein
MDKYFFSFCKHAVQKSIYFTALLKVHLQELTATLSYKKQKETRMCYIEKEVHTQIIYIIHWVAFAFVLVFFSFFKPSKFPFSKLQYACWNLFTSLGCTWKERPNKNLTQKKIWYDQIFMYKKVMVNMKNVGFLDVFVQSINEFCGIFKTSLLIKTKCTSPPD